MESIKPKKKPRKDYPALYNGTGPVSPYQKLLGEEYRMIALLEEKTRTETKGWLLDAWKAEEDKLLQMMQRTNIPAGQKLIAACLVNAIQIGDFNMLTTFLNRIVGKVREEITVTTNTSTENANNARQTLLESMCEPAYRSVNS